MPSCVGIQFEWDIAKYHELETSLAGVYGEEISYLRIIGQDMKDWVDNNPNFEAAWAGGYPMSAQALVNFAIEYQLFGENPAVSHFINVLLYALTVMLLFKILSSLFKSDNFQKWFLTLPFIITVLFTAHPIHTEVVANIKGRDEIMTFLGALLALWYSLKYLENQKIKYLIYSGIYFFLGLLSKENAITFIAIIPITLYYFKSVNKEQYLKIIGSLLIPTFLFLFIRYQVIGSPNAAIAKELMNNPFLHASNSEKFATIFSTFIIYFKLLIFPHPLSFDYYPKHIPIVNWNNFIPIASLLINMALGLIALFGLKKKSVFSYSIWFYFISFSIVSNIVFPIGTFMNERFIYISSLGFCIVLAYFIIEILPGILKQKNQMSIFILIAILGLYSFKTIDRNKVWKNDFTLFTQDVKISSNSAKSNTSAGGKLLEEATKKGNETVRDKYLQQSIQYLEKAIKIHPTYVDALLLLGNAHYEYNRNYDGTLFYYKRILNINPKYQQVYTNLDIIFNKLDSVDYEIKVWNEINAVNPDVFEVNYNLGNLYGRFKNDLNTSIIYLEKAVKINSKKSNAWKDLGVAYGIIKDYKNSARCLENAVKYNPKDAQTYFNLGITFLNIGDKEKSEKYFDKAASLDPKIKQKLGR